MPDLKYFTGFGNEFATEAIQAAFLWARTPLRMPRSASTPSS